MFFKGNKKDSQPQAEAQEKAQKTHLTGIDEYFSDQFRRILIAAAAKAKEKVAQDIDTEYLLWGYLEKHDAVADKILEHLKVKGEEVISALEKIAKPGKNKPEKLLFSPRSKRVLELADKARREFRHHSTSSEHLFLALLREKEGVAARLLVKFGVEENELINAILKIVGRGHEKDILTNYKTPVLDEFGRDLCEKAREGKLDPVIGRVEEIERTIHILARRRKNNPVLMGEPGVGKTAIVEGLAAKIAIGDIPESLKGKRIIEISFNNLIAGASKRGEFEKRIQNILKEAQSSAGEVILFIDEIHTLISGGESDVANILKPALARGELHCIGATTTAEYHQYIESDAALERRFQPVRVEEPSHDEALEILRGLRDKYEAFHKVQIPDEILARSIRLTNRYINDRFLPDKAVDLIDEAASVAKMPSLATPEKLKNLNKEIEHLIGEREQAKKNIQVEEITRIEKLLASKQQELTEAEEEFEAEKAQSRDAIREEHLNSVMSRWTGVPLSHLKSSEQAKLLSLEDEIHERVIGQAEAVKLVAQAVRRGRAGLKKVNLPIGSFLFMGPTGVGKTQIAKTLAETLFGLESALIRFDMSEFMEKHAVSRLLGPPPGYIGYEAGGELTEAVRRKPFSVILFDEVEKAHPDIYRIFLQLLDDGRLTDNHGRLVSFKNTIIICTSNIAAQEIAERLQNGLPEAEDEEANSVKQETATTKTPELKAKIDSQEVNKNEQSTSPDQELQPNETTTIEAGSNPETSPAAEQVEPLIDKTSDDYLDQILAQTKAESNMQAEKQAAKNPETAEAEAEVEPGLGEANNLNQSNNPTTEALTTSEQGQESEANNPTKATTMNSESQPAATTISKPSPEDENETSNPDDLQETKQELTEAQEAEADLAKAQGTASNEQVATNNSRKLILEDLKNRVMPELMKFFKPELINRFDNLVFFEPLSKNHIVQIVDLFLLETSDNLSDKKMTIELTAPAKELVAERGFDPQFGARPLKRAMRTLIDDPLADKIIRGDFVSKDHIIVAVESNTNEERYLVFRKGTSSINEDTDASVNSLESRVLENLRSAPNSEEAGQQASQNPDETEQKTPNEQQQSNTNEPRQGRHAQAEAISPVLAMSAPVPRTANQEQAQGNQAPTPEKQANSQAEANINPALNNSEINPEAVTNEQGNLGPTPFNPHKPENLQQENQNPQINPGQDPEESIEDKIFKDIGDLDFD